MALDVTGPQRRLLLRVGVSACGARLRLGVRHLRRKSSKGGGASGTSSWVCVIS